MNESFSSRVDVGALLAAVQKFADVDTPNPVFVNVTVDDHGDLTIAPDPVAAVTLSNTPA